MVTGHPHEKISSAKVVKSASDYLALLEARSVEAVEDMKLF